jgi:4'-phosphopantetheinyl transferase
VNGASAVAAPAPAWQGRSPARATCSVWWATPTTSPALSALLDPGEQHRLARIVGAEDRARYLTSHALVRLLLANRTGVPATDLRIERTCRRCGGDHGKPQFVAADGCARSVPVAFNLAHAGDRVVVAIADDHGVEVGVDVEAIPGRDDAVLAGAGPGLLTAAELAVYRGQAVDRRGYAFARWWTRKESLLKATGEGLTVPLSAVEVTAPDAAPALVRRPPPEEAVGSAPGASDAVWRLRMSPVTLHDLDAGPGYVGCVSLLGASSVGVIERDADPLLGAA